MKFVPWIGLPAGLLIGTAAVCGQVVLPATAVEATNTWRTYDIRFLTDQEAGGSYDQHIVTAGMDLTAVNVPGVGVVTVWDLCTEFFVGPNTVDPWSVTEGMGGLDPARQQQVRALVLNAFPLFDAARVGGDEALARSYGAAIQIALWEII